MDKMLDATWRCRFGGARWREARWAGWDTGWRELPLVLVETARGGRWRVETEDDVQQAGEGETLVVAAGIRHRMIAEVPAAGRMVSSWVFVEWEGGGLPVRAKGGVAVKAGAKLAKKVERMAARKNAKEWGEQAARAGVAFEVLSELAELFELSPGPDERVARAMEYVRKHVAEPVRRADLARAAGVSEAHLQELFRAAAGVSPMEYVIRLRLRRAMDLLARTGLPVGQVAERCGFASPYYFARLFRRRLGVAPSGYRIGKLQ
jgi:AraC-like DNA-binding protein